MLKLRLGAYRTLQAWVVEPLLLPRMMSEARIDEARRHSVLAHSFKAAAPGLRRAWFHAASVGELESLTPVILEWMAQGDECLVTVLSESARGSIRKLEEASDRFPGKLLFAGYSPWEGRWEEALRRADPGVFVTAKYEAWPELWIALEKRDTPLAIVSAKARRSLRIASSLCRILGGRLPRIRLLTVRDEDSRELARVFAESPSVETHLTGEPRWDRVQERARQGNARARELIAHFRLLPRPWGVLGSVWPEDLEVWRGRFASGAPTLWVVPHRVDPPSVEAIEKYLLQGGLSVARSSKLGSGSSAGPVNCILVDEMGFLLELYSAADWAYVGGGFGVSMHSTIEPAIFAIPVSCGPEGAGKFPEIAELREAGQLTVVGTSEELGRWLAEVSGWLRATADHDARRAGWRAQIEKRLGATKRVLQMLRT